MQRAQLRKNDDIWIFESPSPEWRWIAKSLNFRWNPDETYWWTDDINNALPLTKIADDECLPILLEEIERRESSIEKSLALDSDLDIPKPQNIIDSGLDYFPFQKGGIEFIIDKFNQGKSTLLADDMGLGKTIQAIGIMNHFNMKNVLVISPNNVKINWSRELQRWLVNKDIPMRIVDAKHPPIKKGINIVNYAIIKKYKDILTRDYDMVIVDEAHYIKSPKAKRTQYIRDICEDNRSLLMTGTPIVNRPKEIYELLWILDKELRSKNSFWNFMKKFTGAYNNGYGYNFNGASNLEELQILLRSGYMVRRMKDQVLTELPDKTRQLIYLEPDQKIKKALKEEELAIKKNKKAIETALANLNGPPMGFSEYAKARHHMAVAKIDRVVQYIKETLESVDKVIVFAHHRDLISGIHEAFGDDAREIVGGMTNEERQAIMDEFQEGSLPIVVIQDYTGREGITLTASSTVIFAELMWVPGFMQQAEDRAHRHGQKNNVNVYYLVVDDSIEGLLGQKLAEKLGIIEQSVNVNEENRERISFTRHNDEKYDEIVPLIENAIKADIEIIAQRKHDVNSFAQEKRIDVPPYSPENEERTIRALDQISDHINDGFVQSLASKNYLSPKQYVYGIMNVQKFKNHVDQDLYDSLMGDRKVVIQKSDDEMSNSEKRNLITALDYLIGYDQDCATVENQVGFSGSDTGFAHSLWNQYQKYGALSIKQFKILKKILKKYHRQIPSDLYEMIYGEGNHE